LLTALFDEVGVVDCRIPRADEVGDMFKLAARFVVIPLGFRDCAQQLPELSV
jgi:hypothetical protein